MAQSYQLSGIPARFRQLRESLGLSQEGLADALQAAGVPETSFGSIRRYESGKKSPSVEVIRALAQMAQLPVGSLLDDDEQPETVSQPMGFVEVPTEGVELIGHLQAELMRREDGEDVGGPHEAFQAVERRVVRLRSEGRLSDAGWNYWLALRRGAVLSGGYHPDGSELTDPASDSSAQSIT